MRKAWMSCPLSCLQEPVLGLGHCSRCRLLPLLTTPREHGQLLRDRARRLTPQRRRTFNSRLVHSRAGAGQGGRVSEDGTRGEQGRGLPALDQQSSIEGWNSNAPPGNVANIPRRSPSEEYSNKASAANPSSSSCSSSGSHGVGEDFNSRIEDSSNNDSSNRDLNSKESMEPVANTVSNSSSPQGDSKDRASAWSNFVQRVRDIGQLCSSALAQSIGIFDRWYIRLAAIIGFVLALISTVINMVLVPIVNYQMMPGWQQVASQVTQRQVQLGRVNWVSLGGIIGLAPLVSMGPMSVGPSPLERSCINAPQGLAVYLDPVALLLSQQAVFNVHMDGAEATVVQGDNFSWLGYPEDTIPSSRNLLPGLSSSLQDGVAQDQQSRPWSFPSGAADGDGGAGALQQDGAQGTPFPVALGSVAVRNGRLAVQVHGEASPRWLEHINGGVLLADNYRSLELHAEAAAHERDPSSHKCTTLNPPIPAHAEAGTEAPKRHLRHVTPGARTPDLIHFGCDNLPRDVSAGLVHLDRLKEISRAAGAGAAPQPSSPHSAATVAGPQDVLPTSSAAGHSNNPAMPDHSSSSSSSSSSSGHARSSRHRGRRHTRAEPFPPPPADPQGAGAIMQQQQQQQQQQPSDASAPHVEQQAPEVQQPQASAHVPASKGRSSRWRGQAKEPGTAQAGYPASDGRDLGREWGAGSTFPATGGDDSKASRRHSRATNARGQQESHSQGASTPAVCSYWVHDLVRPKRGKAAEVAIATGEPPVFVLRDFGQVMPAEAVLAIEEAQHTLQTSEAPYVWPQAPWNNRTSSSMSRASGGNFEVHVSAQHMNTPGVCPDVAASIQAKDLHAPLVERLLELPMDIYAGRLSGELRLRIFDQRTWQFPEIYGTVNCRNGQLHFWDSPDDVRDVHMQMVFEAERMYLHGARGAFGAIPLAVTGDMDLNPDAGGCYRLSATVGGGNNGPMAAGGRAGRRLPLGSSRGRQLYSQQHEPPPSSRVPVGVGVNALRATLGIRPLPVPVAGSVRGVLHCTGPLEKPVFSGTAVAVRPPSSMPAPQADDATAAAQAPFFAGAPLPAAMQPPQYWPTASLGQATGPDPWQNLQPLTSPPPQEQQQPKGGGWVEEGEEASDAQEAMLSRPEAVGGYDRIPILSATGVFTLDTATEVFSLHSAKVIPVGGGQTLGSGTMLVSPAAESHPAANNIHGEARDVDAGRLATCYLPVDVADSLPEGALAEIACLGRANAAMSLTGSHLEPKVAMRFALAPDSRLLSSGRALLGQRGIHVELNGPALHLDAMMHTSVPRLEQLRKANTQAEAKAAAWPRFEGLDLEASMANLDVLPLVASPPNLPAALSPSPPQQQQQSQPQQQQQQSQISLAEAQREQACMSAGQGPLAQAGTYAEKGEKLAASSPATADLGRSGNGAGAEAAAADAAAANSTSAASRAQPRLLLDPVSSGQPLRARVSGSVRMALRSAGQGQSAMPGLGVAAEQSRKVRGAAAPMPLHQQHALMFDGPIIVSGVRLNSLGLVRQLSGQMGITGTGKVVMRAMGNTSAAPPPMLAAPTSTVLPTAGQTFGTPPSVLASLPGGGLGSAGPLQHQQAAAGLRGGLDGALSAAGMELLELEAAVPGLVESLNLDPQQVQAVQARCSSREWEDARDSRLALRGRNGLTLAADVYNAGAEYRMQVSNLPLDDLEAGSLRGALTSASMEASMEDRQGRACFELTSLRYASLTAGSFSSSLRWEGDVVKLEETVLTQANSRYELSGEVFLPETSVVLPMPRQGMLAPQPFGAAPPEQMGGSNSREGRTSSRAATSLAGSAPRPSPPPPPISSALWAGTESERGPSADDVQEETIGSEALAGDTAEQQHGSSSKGGGGAGRWRLAVHVPYASVSDLLPATQLMSALNSQPGADYGTAKQQFLEALRSAPLLGSLEGKMQHRSDVGKVAEELRTQVDSVITAEALEEALSQRQEAAAEAEQQQRSPRHRRKEQAQQRSSKKDAAAPARGQRGSGALPALQELSGKWCGRIEMFGVPAGATNIDFSLRGEDWRWGASSYRMDRLVAAGNADSSEGLVFEELSLTSGPAMCVLRGALLGARQEATLHVADFPLDLLAPLQQALPPALQGALAAAEPKASRQSSYMRPFAGLTRKMESSLSIFGVKSPHSRSSDPSAPSAAEVPGLPGLPGPLYVAGVPAQPRAVGPVSGLMYIDGRLGGSSSAPEAELNARLAQGAVGDTRLAKASAQFSLDAHQRAHCLLELSPADMAGHVRMAGDVQLTPPPSSAAHREAAVSAAPATPHEDLNGLQKNHMSGATGVGANSELQAAGSSNRTKDAGIGNGVAEAETEDTAQLRAQGVSSDAGLAGPKGDQGSLNGSGSELVHGDSKEREQGHAGRQGELEFPSLDATTAEVSGQEHLHSAGRTLPAPSELPGASLLQGEGRQERGTYAAKKASSDATADPDAGQVLPEQEQEQVDVSLVVSDGGMALISALVPGCSWQSGAAAIDLRVHGSLKEPGVEGAARLSRGLLKTPFLRSPVQGVAANVMFDGRSLVIDNAEARVGRHGSMKAHGRLPLHPNHDLGDASSFGAALPAEGQDSVVVDLGNLDLRVSNLYTGMLDASLSLGQSLSAPHLGGWLRFSKGTLFLLPQSSSSSPASDASPALPAASTLDTAFRAPSSTATSSALAGLDMAASSPLAQPASSDADMVTTAFSMLKAGRKRSVLLHHLGTHAAPAVAEGTAPGAGLGSRRTGGDAGGSELHLAGLNIMLGPDFRAVFPVVLNVAVSGQVTLHGPADPLRMQPSGALSLDGGALNLVASQFVLDREHSNRIVFQPELGMDPIVDVLLLSGDLRAAIQGRGSTWQEGLTLSASGTPLVSGKASAGPVGGGAGSGAAGSGGNSGGARGKSGERLLVLSGLMEPPEVARVFEERLAEALLVENGQLALRSLASSTFSNLLPKIETHGQLGAARWRLVGAPSLPNLLGALDALAASSSTATTSSSNSSGGMDPARFLSSLAVGTELDLVLGKSLTASLAHKLHGDSKIGTEATFTYSLSDFLRLQLQLQGLTRPSLLLGYNSATN